MSENEKESVVGRPERESETPVQGGNMLSRAELVQALVDLLMVGEGPEGSQRPSSPEPLSARELEQALEELHNAGFTFDETGALRSRESSEEPDRTRLTELQLRYPLLPREVTELLWSILTGNEPELAAVGSTEVQEKQEIVRRRLLTEELRERFYLRECGKVPRFRAMDWEVVIKVVERGHQDAPNYPYALVTLDTVNEVHGHHEHETLSFSIGRLGLRRFIAELVDLQTRLDDLHHSLDAASKTSGS